jgi:hypothetical protein
MQWKGERKDEIETKGREDDEGGEVRRRKRNEKRDFERM